ncbi:MAG: hypothetical protein AAB037_03210 [Chloroflexota bacterium]
MPTPVKIDAQGLSTKELNNLLRQAVAQKATHIELSNVSGQRYLGTDLDSAVEISIYGTPGNDLGSFMDGPRIIVYGNAQDGCGNTMNSGEIIIHGHAGDILALSARGGRVFVQDGVGYRAGIHMKGMQGQQAEVVIGGSAQDFLGEYMAGGVILLLGLNLKEGERHQTNFIGTGMHGGVIYLRGQVEPYQLGKEVGVGKIEEADREAIRKLVDQFCAHFTRDPKPILDAPFLKLFPLYLRPYGRLYAY